MTMAYTDLVTVPLFSHTVAQSPVPGMVMLNATPESVVWEVVKPPPDSGRELKPGQTATGSPVPPGGTLTGWPVTIT
jgi:hypothetical protein